jgi:aldehyde dehydrogenase (NAD+)
MAASYGELIDGLRQTFESGRTRPLEWRKQQLRGLVDFLTDQEDELTAALAADLGRPPFEAYGTDIGIVRMHIRDIGRKLDGWAKPTKVFPGLLSLPGTAEVIHEPLGVTLVIAPWNYPIQLLLEPVAAALAAGNCVVAKPSELAPASSETMARLLPRYVDTDAVLVVEGGVPETTALLEQPWDHIFFTGSTSVGRVVAEAAAKHLTPTTLELGGKSPTYVHASANLDVAARRIVWGKFLNAGQTCIAPDYVLADRSIRDQLVEKLAASVHDFYGDEPQRSASLARIVNDRHVERLRGLLADAGTVVTGGTVHAPDRYVAPTITLDPSPTSPVMQEEIFGPILPVLAVDGPDEAVAFVNARPKPLALYVFAEDDAPVEAVVEGTSSGGVCVNQTLMHIVPASLPFGGVGDSGTGAYHGKAGFDAFSHHRSVLRKPSKPDLKLLYPPYSRLAERLARLVLR